MLRWLHDGERPVYTIKIASELLGCHPRTLRIYEAEGLIEPRRTGKNYRLYSQNDLALIKRIQELMLAMSLNIAAVKALFRAADCFEIEVKRLLDEMLD